MKKCDPHKGKATWVSATILASALVMAGCEWDSSEDQELNVGFDQSDPTGEDNDGSTGGDNSSATVSGVAATSEPIEGAIACIDTNLNGLCESEEPQATTDDDGAFTIDLPSGTPLRNETTIVVAPNPPETRLAESGDLVNFGFNLAATVIPDPLNTGPVTDVFVSPISTLINAERENLPDNDFETAIRNVASEMGTTADILGNYLNPPADSSTFEEAEFQRLNRIAETVGHLARNLDQQIPDSERDNVSRNELRNRIFDQVKGALPDIADGTNRSLVETPNDSGFSSETLLEDPVFDQHQKPVDSQPPSPTDLDLEERIADSIETSPFFEDVSFETLPVLGAALINLQIKPASLSNETPFYYEAYFNEVVSLDGDAAVNKTKLFIPKEIGNNVTEPTLVEDNPGFSIFEGATPAEEVCDIIDCNLTVSVQSVRGLVWSGQSLQEKTVRLGHQQQRDLRILEGFGHLASISDNNFVTEIRFREFSLAGLDGRDTIKELTKTAIPGPGDWAFSSAAKGYTRNEKLVASVAIAKWPRASCQNLAMTVDAEITTSCNVVFGAASKNIGGPAQSLADLLYSIGQASGEQQETFNNERPLRSLLLEGPNREPYIARLVGNSNDDSGNIIIFKKNANALEPTVFAGEWKKDPEPFPRIRLRLPDALEYATANPGVSMGEAFLFQHKGFMRHGWIIDKETNLDTLFGRKQLPYLVNEAAVQETIAGMESIGKLTEHPAWEQLPRLGIDPSSGNIVIITSN